MMEIAKMKGNTSKNSDELEDQRMVSDDLGHGKISGSIQWGYGIGGSLSGHLVRQIKSAKKRGDHSNLVSVGLR